MVLQEIRDRTGINLQVTLVSQADYDNRKATLAASRNLPDLIGYSGRSELRDMVKNGIASPLDDLMKSYGKEILKNIGDAMEGNKIDGVTYAVPNGGTEASVRISFCAVPAFSRVEPVMTSGPVSGQIA